MIWTQGASREVKFAFRLHKVTKNASRQVKICVLHARNTHADLGRFVFPAHGHTKRVSGGQNLRFACAGRAPKMRLGKSKCAFRLRGTLKRTSIGLFSLRMATQNASPEVKICVSPAQGHQKCVSAAQNVRLSAEH